MRAFEDYNETKEYTPGGNKLPAGAYEVKIIKAAASIRTIFTKNSAMTARIIPKTQSTKACTVCIIRRRATMKKG